MLATSTYHNNSIELPTCMLSLLLNNLVLMYMGDVNRKEKKTERKKNGWFMLVVALILS